MPIPKLNSKMHEIGMYYVPWGIILNETSSSEKENKKYLFLGSQIEYYIFITIK